MVSGGKATLVIQTRAAGENDVEEKSVDAGDKTSGAYTGVGIQVKFPGGM